MTSSLPAEDDLRRAHRRLPADTAEASMRGLAEALTRDGSRPSVRPVGVMPGISSPADRAARPPTTTRSGAARPELGRPVVKVVTVPVVKPLETAPGCYQPV